jgi:hypothetical protein
MLLLKLGNLRNASLFPRDPRSFPDAPPAAGIHIHNNVELPHVSNVVGFDEPTVVSQDDMKQPDHLPLEDLIAKYGDSTNTGTSFLDCCTLHAKAVLVQPGLTPAIKCGAIIKLELRLAILIRMVREFEKATSIPVYLMFLR